MPEPTTTTAVATLTTSPVAISALTLFGVSLGLRPDVLIAGFGGALVAIVLLNSVPSQGDTWPHMVSTTIKRMFVALASSLTAGYITPLVLLPVQEVPLPILLGTAFALGAGAQRALRWAIDRVTPPTTGDKP